MADVYLHGHHRSVLASHGARTAADSAAYLLPHLREGLRVLDVGCGPGTITLDLAEAVGPSGEVTGIENVAAPLEHARRTAAERGDARTRFELADVMGLPYADASFDVVHAHQVLQHLTDPIAALREMRRVTRPGGIVAVRDADYSGMTWFPQSNGLDEWRELYHEVTQANEADANAGRKLLSWVREAGFDPAGIVPSAGVWCYATPEDRTWWAELWADRSVASNFAKQAIAHGLADEVGLELLADAWREWGKQPDGWFAVLHGEVLARA